MNNSPEYSIKTEIPGIAAGIVIAQGCRTEKTSGALLNEVNRTILSAQNRKDSQFVTDRKAAVRDMLRFGSYKPTGRGKPASEYLFNAALEGNFPFINNIVDINNLLSVEFLLPISLIDLDKTNSRDFILRHGKENESYVFNPSGQIIELKDLLLFSSFPGDTPRGTPIKDSQETKTDENTKNTIAVIYAPKHLAETAKKAAEHMARLLEVHAGAKTEIIMV